MVSAFSCDIPGAVSRPGLKVASATASRNTYEFAKGHRLQLRLTSYDVPTHLPRTLKLDPGNPRAASLEPIPPAANTVRLGGANPSYLRITALGGS
jgi:predicted acyl esterase